MEDRFLRELEYLGVTARLKRLSDALTADIKPLYREQGVDIEPSWHLVLLLLQRSGTATITQIAGTLSLSQPATTQMITRMLDRGYLDVSPDRQDSRRKNVSLSARAKRSLPRFHRIWDAGQEAIREILGPGTAFFEHLEHFETQVDKRSFRVRATERLNRS